MKAGLGVENASETFPMKKNLILAVAIFFAALVPASHATESHPSAKA